MTTPMPAVGGPGGRQPPPAYIGKRRVLALLAQFLTSANTHQQAVERLKTAIISEQEPLHMDRVDLVRIAYALGLPKEATLDNVIEAGATTRTASNLAIELHEQARTRMVEALALDPDDDWKLMELVDEALKEALDPTASDALEHLRQALREATQQRPSMTPTERVDVLRQERSDALARAADAESQVSAFHAELQEIRARLMEAVPLGGGMTPPQAANAVLYRLERERQGHAEQRQRADSLQAQLEKADRRLAGRLAEALGIPPGQLGIGALLETVRRLRQGQVPRLCDASLAELAGELNSRFMGART